MMLNSFFRLVLKTPGMSCEPERGASFIEFVVAVPVLFFLVFGAVDIGRVLDRRQAATSLATMIAMKAKRECTITKPFSNSAEGPRSDVFVQPDCLDAVFRHSNYVIPNAQILVSVYKLSLDSKKIELWQLLGNYPSFDATHSRYSSDYFDKNENMLKVLRDRGAINIVDKWYDQYAFLNPSRVVSAVFGVQAAYAHSQDKDKESYGACSTGNAYGHGVNYDCKHGDPPTLEPAESQAAPPKLAPTPVAEEPEPSPYLISADNNVIVIAEIFHSAGSLGSLGFFSGASYEVAIF
jgi:hypothetical protein